MCIFVYVVLDTLNLCFYFMWCDVRDIDVDAGVLNNLNCVDWYRGGIRTLLNENHARSG